MAAVGSKILEQMEGDVKRFRHALDYAPGLDYPSLNTDDWGDLSKDIDSLNKSLSRAKRHIKCVERKTGAKTVEDINNYPVRELRNIISACKRK